MKPLICFYKDDLYYYSTEYQLFQNNEFYSETEFLNHIQNKYFNDIKILQINFEAFSKDQTSHSLNVFVLKKFEIIHKNQLQTDQTFQHEFKPLISKQKFITKVNSIKSDISNGRYYQINLTSGLSASKETDISELDLFKYYFQQFQSSYCALIPYSDHSSILCFSPELFLQKTGDQILTRPIKGTSKNDDSKQLILSIKENAELSMIVDLLRNDLQSICEKPVTVSHHRQLLKLNYITHTYSEVSGITEASIPEILKCLCPGGSISGCPKAESLIAIKELEEQPRGFYTGCIGWWTQSDLMLNLTIRSFLNEPQQITYYTGCGIVYDSVAESEWNEFLNKASLLKIKNE